MVMDSLQSQIKKGTTFPFSDNFCVNNSAECMLVSASLYMHNIYKNIPPICPPPKVTIVLCFQLQK